MLAKVAAACMSSFVAAADDAFEHCYLLLPQTTCATMMAAVADLRAAMHAVNDALRKSVRFHCRRVSGRVLTVCVGW